LTKTALPVAPKPGAGNRLVSNSRWNLLAFGISLVINFATIPIVILHIGLDAFGAAGLVLAIYAPFMLVGTVLGQAMVKELSPLMESTNFERAAPVLSAGLFLCVAGSMAVIALLALAGEYIVHLVNKQSVTNIDWSLAFLVTGLGWAAQQTILVLQSTLAAAQRYASLSRISIVASISSAMSIVAGSILLPSYLGFLLGTSVGLMLSLVIWMVWVRRLMPSMFPLVRFGPIEMNSIVKIGMWQGGAHFAGAIGNQVDRYVLGAIAPLAVVGQYNVAMRLQEVVHMGLLKGTEVLFPYFTVTIDDPIKHRAIFYVRASWIINMLGVTVLAPLIPFSSELISLWVNKDAAEYGAQMLRTLAVAGVLGCGVNVYYYFAIGTGQNARLAGLTVAHALLTVILTVFFITIFGPIAAGIGYLVSNAIRLCITLYFSTQYFSAMEDVHKLLGCTLLPLLAGLLPALMWWHSNWLTPSGWGELLLAYIFVACTVAIASIAVTLISLNGRQLVKEVFLSSRNILMRGV
jgi:O-antigen/teichoic acid export membrane protein